MQGAVQESSEMINKISRYRINRASISFVSSLKVLWVICTFATLIFSLVIYDGAKNSDADIVLGYAMLTLSFPLGPLFAMVLAYFWWEMIYANYGYIVSTSYVSIVVCWLLFFIVGYFQWFNLLPWLWEIYKKQA